MPRRRSPYRRALQAEIGAIVGSGWDMFLLFALPLILLGTIGAMLFQGVIREIPVAVVDQDHSTFSRTAIRNMESAPGIRVIAAPGDLESAWPLMRSGKIYSLAYIPDGAARDALRKPEAVIIYYNGAFQTIGALAAKSQVEAVSAASEPIIGRLARSAGLPAARFKPPAFQLTVLGNPQTSFELFLGGLIAPGVLHLLMACATVMAFGRALKGKSLAQWSEDNDSQLSAAMLAKATPYVLIFSLWGFAWIAWLGGWRGWGVEGSLPMLLAGIVLLMAATAAISALLVALTGNMDVSYSATAIYAGSAIAYSNGTLPLVHGPVFAQFWSSILPYTHYLRLQNSQMVLGGSVQSSLAPLLILASVAIGCGALALYLTRYRTRLDPEIEPVAFPSLPNSIGGAFVASLAGVTRARPISSVLLLAVVAYAFYYPLAYAGQTATRLPVVVVDQDHSALSRQLVREMAATRVIDAATVTAGPNEAERMLRDGVVDGVLHIPPRFEENLLSGAPRGIGLYLNGAYLVRASSIGEGLEGAIAAAAAVGVAAPDSAVRLSERLPRIEKRSLYNTTGGYGSYAVPAVSAIILQQTLLLGAALLAAVRRESGAERLGNRGFLGLWAALTLIGVAGNLFYVGFVFWFQDYPRMGNLSGMFMLAPLFAAAACALGLFLGSLFKRHERVMQILVGTSVPLFFLGGAAWPHFMMPQLLAAFSWLSPSTAAIQGFVKLNAGGAMIGEIRPELTILAGLVALFGSLAWLRLVRTGEPSTEDI